LGVALLFEPEELLGAAVLPLDGALPPAEGEVLGVAGLVAALEPLLPDELFWLELELSHAASESTESTAAIEPWLLHYSLHEGHCMQKSVGCWPATSHG
jgi:hypothetical protein